jgi:hypothetical protein
MGVFHPQENLLAELRIGEEAVHAQGNGGSATRYRGVVTTALSLSSRYSPVAAVKVVLPRGAPP